MNGEYPNSATNIEDSYPLSPLQHGMLFNSLLEPGSGVDIEQLVCELNEDIDADALRRAWQCVIARHAALRTGLQWENLPEPRQDVSAQVQLPWEEQDWREVAAGEREERLAQFLNTDRRRGFKLTHAPLFRLALLRHGPSSVHLVWTIHHSILDGRSFALIIPEVFEFYEALRKGSEISPPLPRHFRDYIAWLRQQNIGNDESYWRDTLKGFIAPTPLIVDHAQAADQVGAHRKGSVEVMLPEGITLALRELARRNQLSLNTIVQGGWALLLNRYSDESDVVFGVIRANRRSTIEGAETMIGLFISTLPLRVRVNPDAPLIPWLKDVHGQWMSMRGHEHASLASIQGWSDVSPGRPLFQSTVMFETHDLDTSLRARGGPWTNRSFRTYSQTNYPLDLAAFDGTGLRLRIDYDRRRIDAAAAGRMLGHLQTLLSGMADNPQASLKDLPLLTDAERHQFLVEWNDTAIDHPADTLLHELFEGQAQRKPEQVKVTFEGRHLTNGELEARANQLAHYLQRNGVGPDMPVVICMERSLELVIGVLGILKAGGAYVPVDPDLPPDRIAHILAETKSPVALTQDRLLRQLFPADARAICLDTDWAVVARESALRPSRRATAGNLAYVIYTSGSTGRPKGVMVTHAAICNHMHWMKRSHGLTSKDVELLKAPLGFDASVWELFAPLISDASLVVARPDGHLDPAYLAGIIQTHRISTLQVVPSQLRMLLDEADFRKCLSLERIYCGGEPLTRDICESFSAGFPNAVLYNVYGPTEAAIDSSFWPCPRENVPPTIPIGRPIDNVRLYVVNEQMQLMPVGAPGELLVGGAGIARGYLNDARLTAERFVPDPFCTSRNARLYRTGDLARFLPDGNIEFLGRADHQVKIRGFRIEPGEIEAAIVEHPAVSEAVVLAHEYAPGDKRLIAYIVAGNAPADFFDQLRALIRTTLPEHMVPAYFVALAALPLTPSGKVDRKKLPVPEHAAFSQTGYLAPRTPTEEALAGTWREVLQIDRIGVQDNFFDLGGHSLLLARLISRVNLAHRVKLGVPDLIRQPTIEKVAALIDGQRTASSRLSTVVPLNEGHLGLPVYFIYAGPSEFRIARQMCKGNSVFGIEARWPSAWREALTNNEVSAFPSMQQMVAPYVAALRAHAGSSPCVLAGLSYAGQIAFEAAHQFQEFGGKVACVVLVDAQAEPPSPYQLAWQVWRQDWEQQANESSRHNVWKALGHRARTSWDSTRWIIGKVKDKLVSYWTPPPPDLETLTGVLDENGMPLPWGLLDRLYSEIDRTYIFRVLDSHGILLRTAEIEGRKALSPTDTLGWGNLFTRGLEVIPLAGDHYAIFGEQIPTIAREMDRVLAHHTREVAHQVSNPHAGKS